MAEGREPSGTTSPDGLLRSAILGTSPGLFFSDMKIVSLRCNHCVGLLDVSVKAEVVTCGICNCRMQVENTEGAYRTEILELPDESGDRFKDVADDAQWQAEAAAVDERWVAERSEFVTRDQLGAESVPTVKGWGVPGMICVVLTGFFGAIFGPVVFGAGMICCMAAMIQLKKAKGYDMARYVYECERQELSCKED